MGTTLRCAVIGAGAIGFDHMESWKKHPAVELVGVAEISAERRAEAAQKHKIPKAVEDYRELLRDKDIDAVSIGLPNYLHASVAIDALNAGKHVLLDKPMATSATEAERILAARRGQKTVFMVGQNYRFLRDTQMVRDYIQRGELGDIYHARAHWLRRAGIPRIGSWFTQKKFAGGGCCYDIGVHYLDCVLHCMGNFDAEAVSGIAHSRLGTRGMGDSSWGKGEIDPGKPFDVEDLAVAMIKLKGGQSVVLEVSWALQADNGKDRGIDLYGTDGGASLYPAKIFKVKGNNCETVLPDFKRLPLPEDRFVHFTDCVLTGAEPVVKPEESLKVQKILDAIYESSRSGREVRVG